MRENEDTRSPEEIAHDIERTRQEMGSTIDAIQSKLTPGQMMDQALQYARHSLPADFGSNLGNAVRNNPLPVALIGLGVGWLMMQGQQGSAASGRPASVYDGETTYGSSTGTSSGGGMMHNAKNKMTEMKDRVSETSQNLKHKAGEMTGRAREAVHGARERVSSTAGNGRARLGDLSHRSQEQYSRARDNISRMAEEQPLVLGAIGLALGAMVGALMPPTRREDEMLGHTRDDLLDKAKETGREQAEMVKESVHRVADTARQEAERMTAPSNGAGSGTGDGASGSSEQVRPATGLH